MRCYALFLIFECFVISSIASGCLAVTRSKTRAGPSGFRRPCSQLRSVATLIPIREANLSCDRPYCSRIFRTSDSGNSMLREGFALPFMIAAPCLTLSSNSTNSSLGIIYFRCDVEYKGFKILLQPKFCYGTQMNAGKHR